MQKGNSSGRRRNNRRKKQDHGEIGSWCFKLREAPGTTLTIHNLPKKKATERAFRIAPDCTFDVVRV